MSLPPGGPDLASLSSLDDPVRRRPDITRAVEQLGWKPTIPLDEGLRRTIADFRERIEGTPTPC